MFNLARTLSIRGGSTKIERLILAKLHTADSLSSEYSIISEQRLLDLIVPMFF